MSETLRDAVQSAAARPEVSAAVRGVYDAVQGEIDARRPLCTMSGRCCHFEEYGHRLYVTTIELAAFVRELPVASCQLPVTQGRLPLLATGNSQLAILPPGCPFQRNKLCTVHPARPFGCRIFFCDPTATVWQNDAYERFHAEIQRLHADLNVPYHYVEWRRALDELGLLLGRQTSF